LSRPTDPKDKKRGKGAPADAGDARLRLLLDAIPDAVAVHDDGVFTYVNRACVGLLALRTPDDLLGRDLIEIVHADDRPAVLAERRAVRETGDASARREVRWLRADGSEVTVEVAAQPFELDGRAVVLLIARDLTERQRMQAQLVQADRMASVGALAAGVAHEINNPLAYVVANLGFLAESLPELARDAASGSPELVPRINALVHQLAAARQGAERVRVIARDLKTFARADDERRELLDVATVLASTLTMAENEIAHRARLVTDFAFAPRVVANEARLAQVLLNLVINAAQAIPEGAPDENEISARTYQDAAGRCIVEIADTGCGIAPDVVGKIFEPFFTMKPKGIGTGLGLSICHGIVTALGGEIVVESVVGRGSTFRVVLPAAGRDSLPMAAPSSMRISIAPRRGRVLVVDDEAEIGTILRHALDENFDVVAVTSGREALRLLEQDEEWDVILCDLMMPGMGGADVYERATARSGALADRFVFMTGGAFGASAREFLARIPNERVEKPFNLRTVARVVGQVAGTA
jgi:two-component system cell cycle sensor histidine kinase/response regulator CckA